MIFQRAFLSETGASLGGASRSAPFIQVPLAGVDGIGGRNGDAVHSIRNDAANTPRIVICTINNGQIGVGLPFQVILSHGGQYGDESAQRLTR